MEIDENSTGLFRGFSARHEFSTEWHRFLHPAGDAPHRLVLSLDADRFPMFVRNRAVKIDRVMALVRLKAGLAYDNDDPLSLTVQGPTGGTRPIQLQVIDTQAGGLPAGEVDYGSSGVALSSTTPWRIEISALPAVLSTTVEIDGEPVTILDPETIEDLGLIVHYTFT
jgi:hypothetical protein